MTIQREPFQVSCRDGVELRGLLLIPEKPKAVIQFNGGTAAKKEFYLPFLEFLAGYGYLSCLWDYRGSGESAPASLRHCTYTFRDYGMLDMPAVKQYLLQRFPEYPLLVVGHSAGGQQLGFMDDLEGIRGLLGFAVSTGYMPHMPLSYRLLTNYFFYVFSPLSIALSGYVAARRFNIMEDLPRNVVLEWRAWCEKPQYFFHPKFYGKTAPTGHFGAYPFPVRAYWTTDDPISNRRSVAMYWSHVRSTKSLEITKIQPADYQLKSIGHFGFFRKHMRETLWKQVLNDLEQMLG